VFSNSIAFDFDKRTEREGRPAGCERRPDVVSSATDRSELLSPERLAVRNFPDFKLLVNQRAVRRSLG
jgi:hypothetical protein